MLNIRVISPSDSFFSDVVIMGKKNSKTLGMFPEGAFKDHARKKLIYGAIEDDKLIGYVLFRVTASKYMISITHLCVDSNHRAKGIAKRLLDTIKEKYKTDVRGFSLSCREDFIGPSLFWEKYGFIAKDKVRSRSQDEKYLIKWRYDFGNHDLFSQNQFANPKINALLDSNIIIKLRDNNESDNVEALALRADWLEDETEYYYASEIYNEIKRDQDKERAMSTRKFLQQFTEATFIPGERDKLFLELGEILTGTSINDISDRKQVAECIASNLEYFITMDAGILNVSDIIFEKYQLKIINPANFILFIDQLRNSKDYTVYRIAGAQYEYQKLGSSAVDDILNVFLRDKQGEKKYDFRQALIAIATEPRISSVRLAKDTNGNYIGFFAAIIECTSLVIRLIRVTGSKISNVLFQQLINDICSLALKERRSIILIEEKYLSQEQFLVLQSFGFEQVEQGWRKLIFTGLYTIEEILKLDVVAQFWPLPALYQKLDDYNGDTDNLERFKLQIERKLWPAKILDLNIPTYIVPIRQHWASQLFDYVASSNSLFGAKAELVWNKENIYYRNVRPVSEKAPARILWYVSESSWSATNRHKGIVACSYLDEVHIDSAKTLFQKFKNFGIYEWKHIFELSGQMPYKEIKALKFSDTEVFDKVISFDVICRIMKESGRPPNSFASPVEVSAEIFNAIYKLR